LFSFCLILKKAHLSSTKPHGWYNSTLAKMKICMRMYYLKTICMPCLLGLVLDNIWISTGPYDLDGVHGNVARHLSSNHRLQNWWLFITFTQAPYFKTDHCILL